MIISMQNIKIQSLFRIDLSLLPISSRNMGYYMKISTIWVRLGLKWCLFNYEGYIYVLKMKKKEKTTT